MDAVQAWQSITRENNQTVVMFVSQRVTECNEFVTKY